MPPRQWRVSWALRRIRPRFWPIASGAVAPGGAFVYGAARVFGETTEDMLDHGASPEEARFIAFNALRTF